MTATTAGRLLPEGHWARNGFVVLDTETTGVDVERDLIASISAGIMDAGAPVTSDIHTRYIAVDMPEAAGAINGLTTESLAERATATAATVLEDMTALLAGAALFGKPIVATNATFDLTILDRECRRHGVPTLTARMHDKPLYVVDPIVLDKRAVKYRRRVSETQGARTLQTICQVHGVGWDETAAHTSEYDAVMAGRAVWRLLSLFPSLSHFSLPELYREQIGWHAEQAAGLRDWFRREALRFHGLAADAVAPVGGEPDPELTAKALEFEAKAASVTFDWPLIPYRHTATALGNAEQMGQVATFLEQQDRRAALGKVCEIPACGCSGEAHP